MGEIFLMTLSLCVLVCVVPRSAHADPLRVHPTNPRYFTDGSGKAIYLTGSHTWSNLKDLNVTDPPTPFDFNDYLTFFERYHHNFIRLWTWELSKYTYAKESMLYAAPFPWKRTGPGAALDGKPQFDLTRFDEAYFDRLRERVVAAGKWGIYVSVMLFEGHGVQLSLPPWRWDGHPFNAKNNVNGINGDPNDDGRGIEIHTLEVPAVTAIQEAYVRKVIDTVNDLDNVLYEIANEAGPYSTEWQYHMIRFVKAYGAPKQHPVGMTFQYEGGKNQTLYDSPADWISPNPDDGYREDPPAGDGRKIILSDTDHLWGIGGNRGWVWKTFLRGHQPIYMDPFDTQGFRSSEEVRAALGHTLRYAERMNLAAMTPRNGLASTGYCLANPAAENAEYLVYLPDGGETWVDLSGTKGPLTVEWFNPGAGKAIFGGTVSGGERRVFVAPFDGDAVLYLAWTK